MLANNEEHSAGRFEQNEAAVYVPWSAGISLVEWEVRLTVDSDWPEVGQGKYCMLRRGVMLASCMFCGKGRAVVVSHVASLREGNCGIRQVRLRSSESGRERKFLHNNAF